MLEKKIPGDLDGYASEIPSHSVAHRLHRAPAGDSARVHAPDFVNVLTVGSLKPIVLLYMSVSLGDFKVEFVIITNLAAPR